MIVAIAIVFRLFLRRRLLDAAHTQADRGLAGSREGHATMDVSVQAEGSVLTRLRLSQGFTSVAHVFVMDCAAVLRDVVIGLVVAAVLWNGGISFGGVVAFIFADLITSRSWSSTASTTAPT